MEKIMLSQVLEKICVEEAAAITAVPVPKLSYEHRRKMNRIFSVYQKRLHAHKKYHVRGLKKVILIVTIIFLAMFTVAAGAAAIYGFKQNKHHDYTELLTVNAENCPKTIENVYYLSELPEGYVFHEEVSDKYSVYISYAKTDTNRYMVFTQYIKEGYRENFDNEHKTFEELEINGHYALYLNGSDSENIYGTIVWDNEDYVLEISGDFTKEELVNLAKSAKF